VRECIVYTGTVALCVWMVLGIAPEPGVSESGLVAERRHILKA